MNFSRADMRPYLTERIGKTKLQGMDTDEWQMDCPICEDTGKYNLWYNVKKNRGTCYKCEASFDPISLVREFESCSLLNAIRVLKQWTNEGAVSLDSFRTRVREALKKKEEVAPQLQLKTIDFPIGYVSAASTSRWPKYLQRVGSRKLVIDYEIGWCEYGYYKQRAIIPIRVDGRMVSFVARAMWKPCKACNGKGCEVCGEDNIYKAYLYPKGFKTKWLLFNYDRAKEFDHIVICEGAFDAIRVGPRGVAALGSRLSDEQVAMLLASKAKSITLLYDADKAGHKASKKAIEKLKPFYQNIRLVTLPKGRDPDEFERWELWRIIDNTPFLGSKGGLAARVRALLA